MTFSWIDTKPFFPNKYERTLRKCPYVALSGIMKRQEQLKKNKTD